MFLKGYFALLTVDEAVDVGMVADENQQSYRTIKKRVGGVGHKKSKKRNRNRRADG